MPRSTKNYQKAKKFKVNENTVTTTESVISDKDQGNVTAETSKDVPLLAVIGCEFEEQSYSSGYFEDAPPSAEDCLSNDEQDNSDSDSGKYDESYEATSSSDDGDDSDSSEDVCGDFTQSKTFSSGEEKCYALWAYAMRHRLTLSALYDMLKLKPFGGNVDKVKRKDLEKVLDSVSINFLDVCEVCGELYPENPSAISCSNSCNSLRYAGTKSEQTKQNHKYFIATLSVEEQLKEILTRPNIWKAFKNNKPNSDGLLCDIIDGQGYKDVLSSQGSMFMETVTLSFNTDGAQLFSSSSIDVWPIFLVINELPPTLRFARSNMITWGLCQTKTKPNFSSFFIPFCKEMNKLCYDCFSIPIDGKDLLCNAIVIVGIMDLMAKAPVLCMSYHNGMYGCSTCEHPGIIVKSGGGNARSYPAPDPQNPPSLRTTEGLLRCATDRDADPHGVKTVSPLFAMKYYDIVKGTVPDYMHAALLGVTKKLMALWFQDKYKKSEFSIAKHASAVEARLKEIQVNDNVHRKPTKVTKGMKASEYQVWLLYFGLPCLQGILPEKYLNHFAHLVEGIYLLLGTAISEADLQQAEHHLQIFYTDLPDLYGREHCGLNVHNVGAHFTWYVRLWGPLWAWSCFPYEDMNGHILNVVHGTGNVTVQALKRLHLHKMLKNYCINFKDPYLRKLTKDMLDRSKLPRKLKNYNYCAVAGRLQVLHPSNCEIDGIQAYIPHAECHNQLYKATRIVKDGRVFFSKDYTRMEKLISHIVLIDEPIPSIASIQYFIVHKQLKVCFAAVNRIKLSESQPYLKMGVKHLIKVDYIESEKDFDVIPVSKLKEKLLYVNCCESSLICTMVNFHGLAC